MCLHNILYFHNLTLLCIGTFGEKRINSHVSQEIGIAGISDEIGCDFHSLQLKRNDRVLLLNRIKLNLKKSQFRGPQN